MNTYSTLTEDSKEKENPFFKTKGGVQVKEKRHTMTENRNRQLCYFCKRYNNQQEEWQTRIQEK
jgi:hypothetical protein